MLTDVLICAGMSDSRFLAGLEDPFILGHALLRHVISCNALSKDHNIDNLLTKP